MLEKDPSQLHQSSVKARQGSTFGPSWPLWLRRSEVITTSNRHDTCAGPTHPTEFSMESEGINGDSRSTVNGNLVLRENMWAVDPESRHNYIPAINSDSLRHLPPLVHVPKVSLMLTVTSMVATKRRETPRRRNRMQQYQSSNKT